MQLLNFALRIENVYRKEKKITDQMSNEFINKPFLKALFFFFFILEVAVESVIYIYFKVWIGFCKCMFRFAKKCPI